MTPWQALRSLETTKTRMYANASRLRKVFDEEVLEGPDQQLLRNVVERTEEEARQLDTFTVDLRDNLLRFDY